jgi:iron-sulfur cluster repair protein YtfE (RIC family)
MTLRSLMQVGPSKANELFARLFETSGAAVKTRERLFTELKAELELHTELEEQHLFPILKKVSGDVPLCVEIGEAGITELRAYAATAVGSRAG